MFRHSFVLGLILVACSDELAIEGEYTTPFNSTWTLDEEQVTVAYGDPDVYTLGSFDNDAQFIVAQAGPDNSYNAGLWSRFDWAFVGENLYICQQVFDAATELEAADATPADTSDPTAGGCGASDFTFTELIAAQ